MSGKSIGRQIWRTALLFVFVALLVLYTGMYCIDAKNVGLTSAGVEPLLEYHFHTYFEVNDSVQVAQAIELRNEIIANCVSKKIIAIPLHYHFDPENPVLERKLYFSSFFFCFMFFQKFTKARYFTQNEFIFIFWTKLDNNDTTGLNMKPVGPHPIGSFETWVPVEYFAKLYEWFLQKRSPLTIFIHPLTKNELVDHTDRVVFMGKSYTLNTDPLREVIPDFKSQYDYLKLGYAKPDN